MRTNTMILVAALGLAALPGCKKKPPAKKAETPAVKPEPTPTPTPTPEPTPTPAEPTATDMINKMKHCPSAVAGSETKVAAGKDAVTVTVTAKDKAAVADIQDRAKYLAGLSAPGGGDIKHTGDGEGGGGLGKCPVVMQDVTVTAANTKTGAKITLKPKDASKLADLAKTAQDRAAAMPAAGGEAPATEGAPDDKGAAKDGDKDDEGKGAEPAKDDKAKGGKAKGGKPAK